MFYSGPWSLSHVDICGYLVGRWKYNCQFIGAVEACDSLYFLYSWIHVNVASVGTLSLLYWCSVLVRWNKTYVCFLYPVHSDYFKAVGWLIGISSLSTDSMCWSPWIDSVVHLILIGTRVCRFVHFSPCSFSAWNSECSCERIFSPLEEYWYIKA